MQRGFTITELAVVLIIASILVVLSIPTYKSVMVTARRGEAKVNLAHIDSLQSVFKVAGSNFTYGTIPKANPVGYASSGCSGSGWKNEIGFRPNRCGELRYQYWTSSSGGAFTAVAYGPSDGAGKYIYPDCTGAGAKQSCNGEYYSQGDVLMLASTSGKVSNCRNILEYCPNPTGAGGGGPVTQPPPSCTCNTWTTSPAANTICQGTTAPGTETCTNPATNSCPTKSVNVTGTKCCQNEVCESIAGTGSWKSGACDCGAGISWDWDGNNCTGSCISTTTCSCQPLGSWSNWSPDPSTICNNATTNLPEQDRSQNCSGSGTGCTAVTGGSCGTDCTYNTVCSGGTPNTCTKTETKTGSGTKCCDNGGNEITTCSNTNKSWLGYPDCKCGACTNTCPQGQTRDANCNCTCNYPATWTQVGSDYTEPTGANTEADVCTTDNFVTKRDEKKSCIGANCNSSGQCPDQTQTVMISSVQGTMCCDNNGQALPACPGGGTRDSNCDCPCTAERACIDANTNNTWSSGNCSSCQTGEQWTLNTGFTNANCTGSCTTTSTCNNTQCCNGNTPVPKDKHCPSTATWTGTYNASDKAKKGCCSTNRECNAERACLDANTNNTWSSGNCSSCTSGQLTLDATATDANCTGSCVICVSATQCCTGTRKTTQADCATGELLKAYPTCCTACANADCTEWKWDKVGTPNIETLDNLPLNSDICLGTSETYTERCTTSPCTSLTKSPSTTVNGAKGCNTCTPPTPTGTLTWTDDTTICSSVEFSPTATRSSKCTGKCPTSPCSCANLSNATCTCDYTDSGGECEQINTYTKTSKVFGQKNCCNCSPPTITFPTASCVDSSTTPSTNRSAGLNIVNLSVSDTTKKCTGSDCPDNSQCSSSACIPVTGADSSFSCSCSYGSCSGTGDSQECPFTQTYTKAAVSICCDGSGSELTSSSCTGESKWDSPNCQCSCPLTQQQCIARGLTTLDTTTCRCIGNFSCTNSVQCCDSSNNPVDNPNDATICPYTSDWFGDYDASLPNKGCCATTLDESQYATLDFNKNSDRQTDIDKVAVKFDCNICKNGTDQVYIYTSKVEMQHLTHNQYQNVPSSDYPFVTELKDGTSQKIVPTSTFKDAWNHICKTYNHQNNISVIDEALDQCGGELGFFLKVRGVNHVTKFTTNTALNAVTCFKKRTVSGTEQLVAESCSSLGNNYDLKLTFVKKQASGG